MSDSMCPRCAAIARAALAPQFRALNGKNWTTITDDQIQFCGVLCARAAFLAARKIIQNQHDALVDAVNLNVRPIIIERKK